MLDAQAKLTVGSSPCRKALPRPNTRKSHLPISREMSVDEIQKNSNAIALLIDHTMLKPDASQEDIARACAEAHQYGFAAVCVNPYWVRFAVAALRNSGVKVCTTVGFPLGANESSTKLTEARSALVEGARELDVVQNIGALRSGQMEVVRNETRQLAEMAHGDGAILKVILEVCLLSEEEKISACRLAIEAGADFVKTSTGFGRSGATVEDVRLMRRTVGESAGVKAAGGVRTRETLWAMVEAGANRIGTSSSVQIIQELDGGQSAETPQPLAAAKVPGGRPDTY